MNIIEGGNRVVMEPDWALIYSDPDEQGAAADAWRMIERELNEQGTLALVNSAAMERWVSFRLIFDKAAKQVAEKGAVIPPKRGSKTAIARPSPYFKVMQDTAAILDRAEAELGLSPRRRGGATKIDRKQRHKQAADAYLRKTA